MKRPHVRQAGSSLTEIITLEPGSMWHILTPRIESQETHTHTHTISPGNVEIVCHRQARNFEEILKNKDVITLVRKTQPKSRRKHIIKGVGMV